MLQQVMRPIHTKDNCNDNCKVSLIVLILILIAKAVTKKLKENYLQDFFPADESQKHCLSI